MSSAPIPLRPLSTHSRPSSELSASLIDYSSREKQGRRSSSASPPPPITPSESSFSVWSDTGDLAEQLASEEDPLHIQLHRSLDHHAVGQTGRHARGSRSKRVHYEDNEAEEQAGLIDRGALKEAVRIPEVTPREPSKVERILAALLSPKDRRTTKMHGLVGKPLLYVSSCTIVRGKC